jgi:hypothetical protein
MELINFIIGLIILLVLLYVWEMVKEREKFDSNLFQQYEPVNYNTRTQDCNELTYDKKGCHVETVIPKNINVCGETLTPINNNQRSCEKRKKRENKRNPTVSLKYDFDLLPSFNNSQINNELKTDIISLNSLENDLLTTN